MPPPDSELARWFAAEIEPHEDALRAYLNGMASASDIDDIVQDAYARLLQVRERTAIESPRGLLFAIARNIARDMGRRQTMAKTFFVAEIDSSLVFDEAPGVSESVSRRQEADLLAEAIRGLPRRCREILILRKFEHRSQREISELLGISEHTIEAQITKAIRRCTEYMLRKGARRNS